MRKSYANVFIDKAYISTEPASNLTQLTCKSLLSYLSHFDHQGLLNCIYTNVSHLGKLGPEPSMDAPWNATINTNSSTDSATFYIVASTGAFDSVGFKRPNETAPTGAMMKGFFKYGTQIMWSNDGTYESKFWAQTTDVEGLYKLVWNSDNVDKTDSVPVTIKTASSTS